MFYLETYPPPPQSDVARGGRKTTTRRRRRLVRLEMQIELYSAKSRSSDAHAADDDAIDDVDRVSEACTQSVIRTIVVSINVAHPRSSRRLILCVVFVA